MSIFPSGSTVGTVALLNATSPTDAPLRQQSPEIDAATTMALAQYPELDGLGPLGEEAEGFLDSLAHGFSRCPGRRERRCTTRAALPSRT